MADQIVADSAPRRRTQVLRLLFGALVLGALPLCAIALNAWLDWPTWRSTGTRALGVALVAAGVALAAYSTRLFARVAQGASGSFDSLRQLVVAGPYRWLRNPVYVADVLVLLGFFLMLGHVALLIYALLFALLAHAVLVLHEEPRLLARFGDDYAAYMRYVPRWLPFVSRRSDRTR